MFLYPFGDFHSLNLGWFLLQFKDWTEKIQEYLDNGGGTSENLANVIAPVFNAANSYSAGDYVLYNNELYKANQAVNPGTWDPDAWTQCLIVDEMGSGGAGVDNVARLMIAGQYSATFAYQKYGICRYNDKLWMANIDLPAGGEAWNAAHWDEITVGAGLTGLRKSIDTLSQPINGSMIHPGGSVGESILFTFPSGKWLLMDTHVSGYGVYNGGDGALTRALIAKAPDGHVRIDYLLITHYHIDHVGGLIDWIDNDYLTNGKIDLTNAVVFLPQELTAANISHIVGDDPAELIARQTKIVNALTAIGCTIIRPTEGQTYIIDDAVLRFTNCDHSVYVSGTYQSTNYNDFSLCAYVEYGSQRFFDTADIGPIGQKYLATLDNSLLKSDIMTAPHHGWQSGQTEENGLYPDFIKRIYPNVVLSPNGDLHKPDSGQAPSMYNFENVLQTWCEENSVPNYATCLNGTIEFNIFYQSWEFVKSYIAYIRNNKNWTYNIDKSITIIPSHLYLVRKGGYAYIWLLDVNVTNTVTYYTENTTPGLTDKIAEYYKINNWANNRSFNSFGLAKQNNTGGLNGNVHVALVAINYGNEPYIGIFAKNLQGDTLDAAITGLFFLE